MPPRKKRVTKPSPAVIGRIAEYQPELLNVLLAYFVFEWRAVLLGVPAHGVDQIGNADIVPDYVGTWPDGVNQAVHYLLRAPLRRKAAEPGYISEWLAQVST